MRENIPIIEVGMDSLVSAPRNANRFDAYRLEKLKEAIKTGGFYQPILVRSIGNGGQLEIVDGHHRVAAMREAGAVSVPAVILQDCSADQAALLAISMNRLRGELNLSDVAAIFDELATAGCELEQLTATGFTSIEVDALLAAAQQDVDADMPRAFANAQEQADDPVAALCSLEIEFDNKKDMARAKRALKKAAGSDLLGAGLLRLIDDDKDEEN